MSVVRLGWVVAVFGAAACSLGVDKDYLDTRAFGCVEDSDCLEGKGYVCKLDLDPPACVRVLEEPDAPVPCEDQDEDTWFTGPLACRQCKPEQPGCPEDPDDSNDQVFPGATERCDGLDNDGDDLVDQDDDDYVATKCPLQVGVCLGAERPCGGIAGPLECDAAVYQANDEHYAAEEICGDGLDNNCDTRPDPTDVCQCTHGDVEDCRGGSFGECAKVVGQRTCEGGQWGRCEGVTEASPEKCDGLDNDCDGTVDDDPDDPGASICLECPWNMVFVTIADQRWCVDRWENSRDADAAARPVSSPDADAWVSIDFGDVIGACALASAGSLGVKEVCPIDVWTQACKTANNLAYPYGADFQPDHCNGNGGGPERTGTRATCVSAWPDRPGSPESGRIFDMSGNVAEWVRPPATDQTQKLVYGGSYSSGGSPIDLSCEGREDRAGSPLGAAHIGFRCCKRID